MSFLKECNKLKKGFKQGEDYLEFKQNGYLLFIPLCRNVLRIFRTMQTPAFKNHISYHNCIIHYSTENYNNDNYESHYRRYVLWLHHEYGFYKGFLINLRKINYERNAGVAFTSFNFSPYGGTTPNGDTVNELYFRNEVYDGAGHYYNLDKINKTKYYKGTELKPDDVSFYKTELKNVLKNIVNGMLESLPNKFEYKYKNVPEWYYKGID